MKKIGFISDFFKSDLPGGGESNDDNLIKHLLKEHHVDCYYSHSVEIDLLKDKDCIVIGNFVRLPEKIKNFLIENKKYIIYEHDHKYVSTRDPSKFKNFVIPKQNLINEKFYNSATQVVVLSEICKNVIEDNLPQAKVHSIGCSLWSEEKFELLRDLSEGEKEETLCIMHSNNPTKNYVNTVKYCRENNLRYVTIQNTTHDEFLVQMSKHRKFLFIPTVLETFSRVCAEAKMLNLEVMTNKTLIGFFSEECSKYAGRELIDKLYIKNKEACSFFSQAVI